MERKLHVLVDVQGVEQAVVLENNSDLLAKGPALAFGEFVDGVAQGVDLAIGRSVQTEREAQQGGLSGARRAGQEYEFTGLEAEGDPCQGMQLRTDLSADFFAVQSLFWNTQKVAVDVTHLKDMLTHRSV
jgi:hypothetical protein